MYACAFISFARVHMRAHIYHLRVYMSFASRRARNDMYACTYTSFENARALPLSLSCAYTHIHTRVCVSHATSSLGIHTGSDSEHASKVLHSCNMTTGAHEMKYMYIYIYT